MGTRLNFFDISSEKVPLLYYKKRMTGRYEMNLNTKKLICFDLDGTLLDQTKQISSTNLSMIKKLNAAGHIVSIATGRHYKSAHKVREMIPADLEIICSNGAVIESGGIIIRRDQIPANELEMIYHLTKDHNLSLAFLSLYSVYHTTLGWAFRMDYFNNVINKGSIKVRNLHVRNQAEYMKYAPFYINGIVIDRTQPERIQRLREDLEAMNRFTIESSAPDNVEIMAKTSNKGVAALKLAKRYKISPEDIIAFGDGENDHKLIQSAGVSFAMENACDLLKEEADYVIGHHSSNTIAHTLSELLNLPLE